MSSSITSPHATWHLVMKKVLFDMESSARGRSFSFIKEVAVVQCGQIHHLLKDFCAGP